MTTTIHGWPVLTSTNDPRFGYYRIPGTERSMYARRDVARRVPRSPRRASHGWALAAHG